MRVSNAGEQKLTGLDFTSLTCRPMPAGEDARLPDVRNKLDLLPLRQMVAAAGDAGCVLAGQGLLDSLSRPGRFQILRHGHGAQILAASEFALAEARSVLRQAYGELVVFGAPSVHTYLDAPTQAVMVPVMFLRIDAPRAHLKELLALLQARAADQKQVDVQRARVVIRAEVELARALGLQRQVQEATDGAAHSLCWLSGYRHPVQGSRKPSQRSAFPGDNEAGAAS